MSKHINTAVFLLCLLWLFRSVFCLADNQLSQEAFHEGSENKAVMHKNAPRAEAKSKEEELNEAIKLLEIGTDFNLVSGKIADIFEDFRSGKKTAD